MSEEMTEELMKVIAKLKADNAKLREFVAAWDVWYESDDQAGTPEYAVLIEAVKTARALLGENDE